jgi:hypothetical protein
MTPQENTVSAPPNTAQVDIVLPQAHAYNERIARFVNSEGQPLDISAWTFAMDIRQEHDVHLRVIRPTFTNVWYPVTGYLRTTPHITR